MIGQRRRSCDVPSAALVNAASSTSARSTMPAPPPAGVSSTFRCLPIPKGRRSIVSSAQSPMSSALPVSDRPSTPGKASGNSVMILAFHAPLTRKGSSIRSRGFRLAEIDRRPWDFRVLGASSVMGRFYRGRAGQESGLSIQPVLGRGAVGGINQMAERLFGSGSGICFQPLLKPADRGGWSPQVMILIECGGKAAGEKCDQLRCGPFRGQRRKRNGLAIAANDLDQSPVCGMQDQREQFQLRRQFGIDAVQQGGANGGLVGGHANGVQLAADFCLGRVIGQGKQGCQPLL